MDVFIIAGVGFHGFQATIPIMGGEVVFKSDEFNETCKFNTPNPLKNLLRYVINAYLFENSEDYNYDLSRIGEFLKNASVNNSEFGSDAIISLLDILYYIFDEVVENELNHFKDIRSVIPELGFIKYNIDPEFGISVDVPLGNKLKLSDKDQKIFDNFNKENLINWLKLKLNR